MTLSVAGPEGHLTPSVALNIYTSDYFSLLFRHDNNRVRYIISATQATCPSQVAVFNGSYEEKNTH